MMLNKHNEKDTDDWEQIKGWVGGANKDTKHPIQQEMDRMQMQQPQNFDEGGQADPMPDFPPIPQDPNILRGTNAPVQPIPSAPVSDPAQPYNDKASQILGTDPGQISQLLENLRQQSNKSQIGAGIAGLGDAIASVGGNNPNHLGQAEDLIQKNRDFGLKGPELRASLGKQQFELSQNLQEQNPNSPLSKYAQDAYGGLGDKLGIDLRHASAKMIGDITGKTIDQLKNEAEEHESHELHQQNSAVQGLNAQTARLAQQNTEKNDAAERQAAGSKHKIDVAKDLNERPWYQKGIDFVPPLRSKATQLQMDELDGGKIAPMNPGQTIVHPSGAKITRNH